MEKQLRAVSSLMVPALLLVSCGTMRTASEVRDDVYHTPSSAPPEASSKKAKAQEEEKSAAVDDYYDPGTAQRYEAPRSYYDMAYNDPHYYNYGRFGFGMGSGMGMGMMGWQSGWNGPGWGMGMGYGWGAGMGMGWNSPWGWDPYYGGLNGYWNSPRLWNPPSMWWMNRNDPWGWGNYGYGGYGGGYWGPGGNCYSCYYPPLVVGVPRTPTVFQHRPAFGGGGRPGVDPGRGVSRDPGALSPRLGTEPQRPTDRSVFQGRLGQETDRGTRPEPRPGMQQPGRQPSEPRPSPRLGRDSGGGTFDRGGGLDRGGAPSRPGSFGGGGGSRPSASPRPR